MIVRAHYSVAAAAGSTSPFKGAGRAPWNGSRYTRAMSLQERLCEDIRAHGAMPFWRFMQRALYEPELGYYARADSRVGRAGDFVTSSSLSAAFGRTLGRLLPMLSGELGTGGLLRVVDAGAGEGGLIEAIAACPAATAMVDGLDLVALEPGAGLAARLRARLAGSGHALRLVSTASELAALEPASGMVVANELFDALPARRLRRLGSVFEEAHVGLSGGRLVEIWLRIQPVPALSELPEARECALQVGVEELLAQLAGAIERGLVLCIDYGYPAGLLYAADGPGNPLRGYHRGVAVSDLLAEPGTTDLTSHVDWTRIACQARQLGLDVLFFTDQASLLLALGFLDDPAARASRRLILPDDLGGHFHCLGLGKQLAPGAFGTLPMRDRKRLLEQAPGAASC